MRWYIGVGTGTLLIAAAAASLLVAQRSAMATPPAASSPEAGCQDRDGDGFGLGCRAGKDCNDQDSKIRPGQPETCNLRDDDCNGLVDDMVGCTAPPVDSTRVHIPASKLLMGTETGSPDERPMHEVGVSAFSLDRHEVTNQQYDACVKAGACTAPSLPGSHLRKEYGANPQFAEYPVIFVNWAQAEAYCRAAGGRLPTEAQWELAARGAAPSKRTYPWGDESPDCTRANLGGPGGCVGDTDRVGRRPEGASPFGVADMAGNVWEWTADWYDAAYYQHGAASDPQGPASGSLKVMRGGCFVSGADSLRVSCRKAELPATWAYNVGIRCAYAEVN